MDSPRSTIGDINLTVAHDTLEAPAGLEDRVRMAVLHEGFVVGELSIVLTDHQTVTSLNEQHLSRPYATDVLAFDLGEPDRDDSEKRIDGEIYVDLDTAVERAPEFGSSYDQEVCRYVIHGLLHLLGYRDDKPESRKQMRRLENLYLSEASK